MNSSTENKSNKQRDEVEKVIKKKIDPDGKILYYVKWLNCSESDNSWIYGEDLYPQELVDNNHIEEEDKQESNEKSDVSIIYQTSHHTNGCYNRTNNKIMNKTTQPDKNVNFLSNERNKNAPPKVSVNDIIPKKYIISNIRSNGNSNASNNKKDFNFDEYLKGNIEYDKPKSIEWAKLINGKMYFNVNWEPRSDGTTPSEDIIPHKIIKSKYPHVLIDFYESRLKFGKKLSNENK